MIYNRYTGWRSLFTRNGAFNHVTHILGVPLIRWQIKKTKYGGNLFSGIEIETINRCNGVCPFCPVNHKLDRRPFARMSEELFEKIIDQLSEMNYSGIIGLSGNNEPFMDNRIVKFAKLARERVPYAYIIIWSNGTLLTVQKIAEISPYIDKIIIDNYDDELKLHENLYDIHEMCRKDAILDRKISIHLRKLNEVLNTRGGQSPNNPLKKEYHAPCIYPFTRIYIRPTGEVSLCCADALGKYTLGDCSKSSLIEIWQGDSFKKVRKKLTVNRKGIDLCRYCDAFALKQDDSAGTFRR